MEQTKTLADRTLQEILDDANKESARPNTSVLPPKFVTNTPRPALKTEAAAEPAPDSIAAILAERGKTHGDFTDNARIMQALKGIVHESNNWNALTDVQREALHMILHKVGRICSGNPNVHDHWDDIAGYAKLVSERI